MSGGMWVRWAAIGAAVAVALGAGGLGVVNATINSGARSTFVPIRTCRLIDTRPAPRTVGTRATPLKPGEAATFNARGVNGRCNIPAGAATIVAQVTAYSPTATGALVLFPQGETRPTTVNVVLNANQPQTGSLATIRLSSLGRFSVYNSVGSVHISVDVQGYYEDHNHDDRYYTKAQVDTAIATAIASVTPPRPLGVVTVETSGGDFTSVQAALDSITDASATKRYTVKVGRGVFTGRITLKDYVDIEGAGADYTTLTAPAQLTPSYDDAVGAPTVAATGAIHAEVRDVTIEQKGPAGTGEAAIAIVNNSTTSNLVYRDVRVSAISNTIAIGIVEDRSATRFDGLDVFADGTNPDNSPPNFPQQYGVYALTSTAEFVDARVTVTTSPISGDIAVLSQDKQVTFRSSSIVGGAAGAILIGSELSGGFSSSVCIGVYDPINKVDRSGNCL